MDRNPTITSAIDVVVMLPLMAPPYHISFGRAACAMNTSIGHLSVIHLSSEVLDPTLAQTSRCFTRVTLNRNDGVRRHAVRLAPCPPSCARITFLFVLSLKWCSPNGVLPDPRRDVHPPCAFPRTLHRYRVSHVRWCGFGWLGVTWLRVGLPSGTRLFLSLHGCWCYRSNRTIGVHTGTCLGVACREHPHQQ